MKCPPLPSDDVSGALRHLEGPRRAPGLGPASILNLAGGRALECSQELLLHLATIKTPSRAKTRRKAVLSASRLAWRIAQHWAQRLSGQSLWAEPLGRGFA